MTKIIVAVTTFKRPKMLRACIESLLTLKVPQGYDVTIFVVDNDQYSSNSELISTFQHITHHPIKYFIEPTPGIPFVRNRALNEASYINADWLAFIDDDEIADENWLLNLVSIQQKTAAHIIYGKVIYQFPAEDKWAHISKFNSNNKEKAEGAKLRSAATNNVLISSDIFNNYKLSLRFDTLLQHAGGSDTDFFNRAKLNHFDIIYAPSAIVYETVPPERCTLQWLYNREKRIAASAVYIDKKNLGTRYASHKHLKRLLINLLQSPFIFIFSFLTLFLHHEKSRKLFIKAFLKLASAHGRFLGFLGKLLTPYKNIEGN